jgi:hypothetical protein
VDRDLAETLMMSTIVAPLMHSRVSSY